jgi:hypothetical protein
MDDKTRIIVTINYVMKKYPLKRADFMKAVANAVAAWEKRESA